MCKHALGGEGGGLVEGVCVVLRVVEGLVEDVCVGG